MNNETSYLIMNNETSYQVIKLISGNMLVTLICLLNKIYNLARWFNRAIELLEMMN
jgi:UDP-glucose 6-dehydrogenase